MDKEIKLGVYEHYKGKQYEVLEIAYHSETLEKFVVYKALYDSEEFGNNAIWIRPFNMFVEKVKIDNNEIPRFKLIN